MTYDEFCAEVVRAASDWIGTPYHHKARIKKIGTDCGGLIYEVYKPFIAAMGPFPKIYNEDWSLHKEGNELYLDFISEYVTRVDQPSYGGISVWKFGRNFAHGAICSRDNSEGSPRFIHAWGRTSRGSVTQSDLSFFNARHNGPRPVRHFVVNKKWLSLSP